MSQKKRIIIHTGPGKTGSSAIQAWLTKNTTWLASQGVFYPKHDLSKEKISSGNLREILTQDEAGNWEVDKDKVIQLVEQFNKSEYQFLLLSSEFFFHRIIQIQKAIPEAEFIAYIRNPIELLESNYNQSVKRHSNTRIFSLPNVLNRFLWQHLETLYNKIDHSKLHLRPFNEQLMLGGNIVADLLSVLKLELTEPLENKRINSSFTFQSMEFKRLLNYFGLGPLEQELDQILQGCDIGEREYSLIIPEQFELLNNESCDKMSDFIDKFSLQQLIPLLDSFRTTQQRPYLKQQATFGQLTEIVQYIKTSDVTLYHKLNKLVLRHPNLIIDNPIIFELFSIEPSPFDKKELIDDLLLKHINQFTVAPGKRGKICYELANFYLLQGDLTNTLMYAKAAHHFNPRNQLFIEKLNDVLRNINNVEHETKSASHIKPSKVNRMNKFKNLLIRR